MNCKQRFLTTLSLTLILGVGFGYPLVGQASLASIGQAIGSSMEARENAMSSFQNLLDSAERGDVQAQWSVAQYYENGSYYISRDYEKAFYWYKRGAEQGNSSCQGKVGMFYLWGVGTKQDIKEAFSWFLKGAEQGNASCQEKVADFYVSGDSGEKNPKKAYEWYVAGAKKGNPNCKLKLGDYLLRGDLGFEKDESRALGYYKDVAENYSEDRVIKLRSNLRLGWCYLNGYGYTKNGQKAFELFNEIVKTGKKGDEVQVVKLVTYLNYAFLAYCYHEGIGCKANTGTALKLLDKAQKKYSIVQKNKEGKYLFDNYTWLNSPSFERIRFNEIDSTFVRKVKPL